MALAAGQFLLLLSLFLLLLYWLLSLLPLLLLFYSWSLSVFTVLLTNMTSVVVIFGSHRGGAGGSLIES